MMVAKLSLLTLALVAHQALASPLPSPDVASGAKLQSNTHICFMFVCCF